MKRTKSIVWTALLVLVLLLSSMPVAAQGASQDTQFGGHFMLKAGEQWNGDLVVFGGTTELQRDSVVNGTIAVMGGVATVDGTINGDLVAFGGTVELGEHAVVHGDLVAFGSVRQHSDATIHGNAVLGLDLARQLGYLPRLRSTLPWTPGSGFRVPDVRAGRSGNVLGALRGLGTILTLLLITLVVEALLPDHLRRITEAARESWLLSLVIGALTVVLLVVVVPILVIICIGIPVAIVFVAALAASALLGWIAIGKLVGRRLLAALNTRNVTSLAETLIGTLLITVLTWIPCIGWLFGLIVLFWGLGAVVLTRFGVYPYSPYAEPGAPPRPTPPAPPPPPPPPQGPASGPYGPSTPQTPGTQELSPFRDPYADAEEQDDRPT